MKWGAAVRVIDIPTAADGMLLNIVMDGDRGEALAYLKAASVS